MRRFSALLLAAAVLGGCATAPTPVPPDAPEATRRDAAVATPAVTPSTSGVSNTSAVDTLLREARDLRDAGDLEASLARLERALRIEPQRAEVYLELARSHSAAGNDERAAASADRGLLYCSGNICGALRGFLAN